MKKVWQTWRGHFDAEGVGCPLMSPKQTLLSFNPGGMITFTELHQDFINLKADILKTYQGKIDNVHVMESCRFLKLRKGFLKSFITPLPMPQCLKPWNAVRGGRVETFVTYMDATADTKLYYKDINSLYSHVSMTSPYVTGKPLVVVGGHDRNFEWRGNKGVSTSKHRLSSPYVINIACDFYIQDLTLCEKVVLFDFLVECTHFGHFGHFGPILPSVLAKLCTLKTIFQYFISKSYSEMKSKWKRGLVWLPRSLSKVLVIWANLGHLRANIS